MSSELRIKGPAELVDCDREIVVVDDDESFLFLIEDALQDSDWHIRSFCDADEALAYLETNQPAALLVDIRMPKMNGDEVLDQLAEKGRLEGVAVFASSSIEPPESIWCEFAKHGARFMTKQDVVEGRRLLDLLAG